MKAALKKMAQINESNQVRIEQLTGQSADFCNKASKYKSIAKSYKKSVETVEERLAELKKISQ